MPAGPRHRATERPNADGWSGPPKNNGCHRKITHKMAAELGTVVAGTVLHKFDDIQSHFFINPKRVQYDLNPDFLVLISCEIFFRPLWS
jgi:hypothetical protein